MGLGLLTKGPIALLVPALAIGAYCVSRGEWLRPLRLLRDPLAWLVMLAIALPWYVLELRAQGQAFIDGFFMKHNVNRFTATMLGHGGSGWYYFALLPLAAVPVRRAARRRDRRLADGAPRRRAALRVVHVPAGARVLLVLAHAAAALPALRPVADVPAARTPPRAFRRAVVDRRAGTRGPRARRGASGARRAGERPRGQAHPASCCSTISRAR